ncbi:DUF4303 domain-containing protein [Paenibacillus sp. CGMCC 1.16610]|uniref:DUF4303 domain-containing protein n=1 Tax=Paenibacillus anseongense TaxID=2682845 RepID=A0ABW9TZL3_9BACL|nr:MULTISPECIES: DUF4303 domain-containing protein [Paenibacillus]MBA2936949.1 DUF4303 domain-containing protein [Paenibacillus sp. CGMCC 1.16610]MVQ33274.1 DUF4303 domain-containing protein [Paenibacillus anseongense]
MNLYYTGICQLLDGNKALKGEGYYVKTDDNRLLYTESAPLETKVVTFQNLEDALFEGCKRIINNFSISKNNIDVYAFNLYADEYNSFYVYMNTIAGLENIVKKHYPNYSDTQIQSLKYNQGDFAFQFYPSDMGEVASTIEGFERMASDLSYEDEEAEEFLSDDVPVVAYEKKIFKDGHYLAALNVVKRLAKADAFSNLNKTEDFIYYAATGHDYNDYSLVMRKTIDPELFYQCFPDLRVKDEEFKSILVQQANNTVEECLDYWVEAFKSEFNKKSPYQYTKTEYDVFLSLERYSRELAKECVSRLHQKLGNGLEDNLDLDEIFIYVKALEFVVHNSDDEIINSCKLILETLDNESDEISVSISKDIKEILNVA